MRCCGQQLQLKQLRRRSRGGDTCVGWHFFADWAFRSILQCCLPARLCEPVLAFAAPCAPVTLTPSCRNQHPEQACTSADCLYAGPGSTGKESANALSASLVSNSPPATCPRRYVLVQADTLQAPTDSELRAARRQLGEPSVSALPGASEQPTPASVARSRPGDDDLAAALQRAIAAAAGAGAAAAAQAVRVPALAWAALLASFLAAWLCILAGPGTCLQGRSSPLTTPLKTQNIFPATFPSFMQEVAEEAPAVAAPDAAAGSPASGHAQQQQDDGGQPAVRSAARNRGGRQAAAQARRPAKRDASAALSDSDVTEEDELSARWGAGAALVGTACAARGNTALGSGARSPASSPWLRCLHPACLSLPCCLAQ